MTCIKNEMPEGIDYHIDIHDDGSYQKYNAYFNGISKNYSYTKYPENHGKKRYWELVNKGWYNLKDQDFDYFLMLPDDCLLVPSAIQKAIDIWEAIDDQHKVTLNLSRLVRHIGKPNWTGVMPEEVNFGNQKVINTQWVDMCFLCTRKFFEALDWHVSEINPNRWDDNPDLGSGVGQDISRRLHKMGYNMYQVPSCLIKDNGGSESKMNPEIRKKVPTVFYYE